MKRLQRIAPNIDGFPIHLDELNLPATQLDTKYFENKTNHHRLWTASRMGQSAILQTLRDLDTSQIQAPRDTHNLYHKLYLPPAPPSLHDALEHIEEARDNRVELRYGTVNHFRKVPINDSLMDALILEYNTSNTDKPRSVYV
jgi:hypothetical protein